MCRFPNKILRENRNRGGNIFMIDREWLKYALDIKEGIFTIIVWIVKAR